MIKTLKITLDYFENNLQRKSSERHHFQEHGVFRKTIHKSINDDQVQSSTNIHWQLLSIIESIKTLTQQSFLKITL